MGMITDFREGGKEVGKERGTERQRHRCERETTICCLLQVPWEGIKPLNLLVHRAVLQPTEPPSQGLFYTFALEPGRGST